MCRCCKRKEERKKKRRRKWFLKASLASFLSRRYRGSPPFQQEGASKHVIRIDFDELVKEHRSFFTIGRNTRNSDLLEIHFYKDER